MDQLPSDLKQLILNASGPSGLMRENRSKKKENPSNKERNRSKKKNFVPDPARTTPAGPQSLKIWDDTPIDFQELARFFRARRCGETGRDARRVVDRIVAGLNRFSGILERASFFKSRIDLGDLPLDLDDFPSFITTPSSLAEDDSTAHDDNKNNNTSTEEEVSVSISYRNSPAFKKLTPHFASLPTTDDDDEDKNRGGGGGGGERFYYFALPPPTIPTGMPEGPSAPVKVFRPEELNGWDFRGFPVRDTNLKGFAMIEDFFCKKNKSCDGSDVLINKRQQKIHRKVHEYCRYVSPRRFEKIKMPIPKELLSGDILTILPVSELILGENYEPHLLLAYNCAEAAVGYYNLRMGQKLVLLAVTNANYLTIDPPACYVKLLAYDLVTDLIWTCTTEVWYHPSSKISPYTVVSFHREALADAYACPYIPVALDALAPMIPVAELALQFYNEKMEKDVKFSKVSAVFLDAATRRKLVIILSGVDKQESHFTYLTEVFLPYGFAFLPHGLFLPRGSLSGCKVLRFLDVPRNQADLDLKFGLYAAKERVSVSLDDPYHSKIIEEGAKFAVNCYNNGVKDERLEFVKVEGASFHLSWGNTYEITFECKYEDESEEEVEAGEEVESDDADYLKYLFPAVATVIHVQANDGDSAFKLVMFLRGYLKE